MFIIVNNKPYAVRNDKAYEVSFGDKGTIKINDEVEDIKVEGQLYNYDEISRKFNLKAMLRAKDMPTKELVEELNKKINELTKENERLVNEIKKIEASKKEVEQPTKVEEAPKEFQNKNDKKNK